MEYVITTFWKSGVTTTSVVHDSKIEEVMLRRIEEQKENQDVKTWMISPSSS